MIEFNLRFSFMEEVYDTRTFNDNNSDTANYIFSWDSNSYSCYCKNCDEENEKGLENLNLFPAIRTEGKRPFEFLAACAATLVIGVFRIPLAEYFLDARCFYHRSIL